MTQCYRSCLILGAILMGIAATARAAESLPVTLTGRGQKATRKVELPAGVHVFDMRHSGQSNFAILPFRTDGKAYGVLVNHIGPFDGSAVFVVNQPATFLFNVHADGRWEILIHAPSKSPDLRAMKGRGQQATEMIHLKKGLYTFQMRHDGKSNFAILPYDATGRGFSCLVNEIGGFDGSCVQPFAEGDYLFHVIADGEWKLTIRKE